MAGPAERREAQWRRLANEPFDLVVVGGGITGAGVARDAALRGARVARLTSSARCRSCTRSTRVPGPAWA